MENKQPPSWIKPDGSVDFSDLDDFDAPAAKTTELTEEQKQLNRDFGNHKTTSSTPRFPCGSCGGSGIFHSWTGRAVGKCFKCKGTGYTRTDPVKLAQQRAKAAQKKMQREQEKIDQVCAFLESRPDIKEWLEYGCRKQDSFAQSLQASLNQYGAWTPNQLAAVERSLARIAERRAERAKAEAAVATDPNALDLSGIPSGMYAVPGGETRLKLRINHVTKGKWLGFIFVDDGAEYGARQKYGMQKPGGKYVGKLVEQLRTIAANPMEASAAYGRLVGVCGICGRKLEDEQSVAFGIGPICRAKFGG